MAVKTKTESKAEAVSTAEAAFEAQGCPHGLSDNLSWLLSQAHYALASEIQAAFEPLGVPPRGYCVLTSAIEGEHTQTELAEIVGLDKTTMVATVDELEQLGLAERRPSKTDRRARVIAVTEAGKRKVKQGERIVVRTQDEVLSHLPANERKVLLNALGTLVGGRLFERVDCERPLRRRA